MKKVKKMINCRIDEKTEKDIKKVLAKHRELTLSDILRHGLESKIEELLLSK